ncbi:MULTISPECIES: DUF488 domain-containing protein [Cyanophyceae]|uniref:DUF488 domain-containing protein n=1 Tax=Cyanophyceae TaxID=3028117 RepID=UPI0016895C45|nr:DUF488 domain-containing protein [Trichocoleus sp. FACHB-40]MBD2005158.1 DUF488 domain-containing protein [Trichocoleus sp. FACHB-40]
MDNLTKTKNRYILTFGYGNRKDYGEFIEYLLMFDVVCVVDVRLRPRAWSRQWYGEQVEKLCISKGIKYVSKVSLGNTSGNHCWIPPDEEEANKALQEVSPFAETGSILLLCAEKKPYLCHRVEVANQLKNLANLPVQHLE